MAAPDNTPKWSANEAAFVLMQHDFETLLDIGPGEGLQSQWFAERGKDVTSIGLNSGYDYAPTIEDDYVSHEFGAPFDAIWASHVLEHQPNVGLFLRKVFRDLRDDGLLAITVPPAKAAIVGGHVSIWNAGLLIYNLILAGWDCRDATVGSYGYNVSVVVRKRAAELPSLTMGLGDIERLAPFFPIPVKQGFDGNLRNHKWRPEA